jgi:hypothetical protein
LLRIILNKFKRLSPLQVKDYWSEIFITESGAVYQSNRERCFWLVFKAELTALRVNDFYQLKKIIHSIDLDAMALNPDKAFDYEIVALNGTERCFILTLSEILALRELLAGASVMLELNSIIYERLYSIPVFS